MGRICLECSCLIPGMAVTLVGISTGQNGALGQEAAFCRSSPCTEEGEEVGFGPGEGLELHSQPQSARQMMTKKTCRWLIECVKCVHAHGFPSPA